MNSTIVEIHPLIEELNWRYATKRFDPQKKVSDEDLHVLLEALRLTPTSYGLQPMQFILVENKEVRQELFKASYHQSQILDASHLLVLCSLTEMPGEYIDAHMSLTAEERNLQQDDLNGYAKFVKSIFQRMDQEEIERWSSNQTYIALGQFLTACARLKIDAIPMEGFEPERYNEILGLQKDKLHATLVCPFGYRAADDTYQAEKKVRKQRGDLFRFLR